MTLQEALKIVSTNLNVKRYHMRDFVRSFPSYREETKELDKKIDEINNKIKKLQIQLTKIADEKDAILERFLDEEMQKEYKRLEKAREVLRAANELIADKMKEN